VKERCVAIQLPMAQRFLFAAETAAARRAAIAPVALKR